MYSKVERVIKVSVDKITFIANYYWGKSTSLFQPSHLFVLASGMRPAYGVRHTLTFYHFHSSRCLIRPLLQLGCPREAGDVPGKLGFLICSNGHFSRHSLLSLSLFKDQKQSMVFLKYMQNYLENITIAGLEQILDRYDFLE